MNRVNACLVATAIVFMSRSTMGQSQHDIFYFNGINVTEDQAQADLWAFCSAIEPIVGHNNLSCEKASFATPPLWNAHHAYNHTQGFVGDLLESAKQFCGQGYFNEVVLALRSPTLVTNACMVSAYNAIVPKYGLAFYGSDLKTFDDRVSQSVATGSSVVLLAHSQGNFFANKTYDDVATPNQSGTLRIVALATPASSVEGDGQYFKLRGDIINTVPSPLNKVVVNNNPPCWDSLPIFGLSPIACHSFAASYLAGDVTGPAIIEQTTRLISENFSNGLPASYLLQAGNAFVSNGILTLSSGCLQIPGPNPDRTFSRSQGLSIEADVNIKSAAVGDFNIWGFYDTIPNCPTGPKNGYYLGWYPQGSDNPQNLLHVVSNGNGQNLAAPNTTLTANQSHHVKAEFRSDGTITMSADGNIIIAANNNTYTKGFITLRSWLDVDIDNLVVRALTSPTDWLSFTEGNPGTPGDGVVVNTSGSNAFGPTNFFHVNPPFPLGAATNGFTTTVFPNASDSASFGPTGVIEITVTAPYLPNCNGGVFTIGIDGGGYGSPPPLQSVIVNGVQGKATNVPQSQVSLFPGDTIGSSTFGSGCNATLSDLYVTTLRVFPNEIGAPLSQLDAASIKLGQNAYPQ